jgi:hypothetical protein
MKYTGRFLLNDAGCCGAFALVPGLSSRSHTFVRRNDQYGGRSALEFNNLTKAQFDALVKEIYGYLRPRPKAILLEVDIPDTAPLEAMIEGLRADLADRVATIERLTNQLQNASPFPATLPASAPLAEADERPLSPEELHAVIAPPVPRLKKRHAKQKRTARA